MKIYTVETVLDILQELTPKMLALGSARHEDFFNTCSIEFSIVFHRCKDSFFPKDFLSMTPAQLIRHTENASEEMYEEVLTDVAMQLNVLAGLGVDLDSPAVDFDRRYGKTARLISHLRTINKGGT